MTVIRATIWATAPLPVGTIVYWASDVPESWKLTTTPGEMRILSGRWLDGSPSEYAKRFGGEEGVLVFADWLDEHGDHDLATALRDGQIPFMLRRTGRKRDPDKEFRAAVIAQEGGDEPYEASGYVVVRIDDWCAIGAYGHCSCYDTWASLTGGGISDSEGPNHPVWTWQGTYAELIDMAGRCADPAMPDRTATPEDYDYQELVTVYKRVLEDRAKSATREDR